MHEDFNSEVIASDYSLEEEVFNNMTIKELKRALDELKSIQKRRIIKYYFYDMTLEAIAKEERCTAKAIRFSINIALEKILKKFQKQTTFLFDFTTNGERRNSLTNFYENLITFIKYR